MKAINGGERMVDKSNPIPLYIQLKDELSKIILEGKWGVDSQIPTEQELMKMYGVGRATVRGAIGLLVDQGYLKKLKGIGTFVIRNKPSLGFEPLISLSFTLKAKGLRGENKVLDKNLFYTDDIMKNKLKWNENKECLYIRRLRLVETMPVAIENSYFIKEFNRKEIEWFEESLTHIIMKDMNMKISKLDQTIILRRATEEEAILLNISENTQVLNMERWIYDERMEEPFYYLNFIVPENIYFLPIGSI